MTDVRERAGGTGGTGRLRGLPGNLTHLWLVERTPLQGLQRPLETRRPVGVDLDESHSEAEFASLMQRLGNHTDPAFVRQINLQQHFDSRLLLMHRVDEASPATQVVESDWSLERADPKAVKRTGDALVPSPAVGLGLRLTLGALG